MVKKDFEDGGFPVNNRAPILCVTTDGHIYIVYNNYDLKRVLEAADNIRRLLGVWPGKMNTDLYILNKEKYGKDAPPEEHKEIDNAETVVIEYDQGEFSSVMYTLQGSSLIICKDPALEDYLKKSGRKYMVRYL